MPEPQKTPLVELRYWNEFPVDDEEAQQIEIEKTAATIGGDPKRFKRPWEYSLSDIIHAGLSSLPTVGGIAGGIAGSYTPAGPYVGSSVGSMAGVAGEEVGKKLLFDEDTNFLVNAPLNLAGEILPPTIGSGISRARGLISKEGLRNWAVKHYGQNMPERFLPKLGEEGVVPRQQAGQLAIQRNINPTVGQITGDPNALNIEEVAKVRRFTGPSARLARANEQKAALKIYSEDLLNSFGLPRDVMAEGEIAEKLTGSIANTVQKNLIKFNKTKKNLIEQFERITPPAKQRLKIGGFDVVRPIPAPVPITQTKNFVNRAVKDIELITKDQSLMSSIPQFSSELSKLHEKLRAIQNYPDVASLRDLDVVRKQAWELSEKVPNSTTSKSLSTLYHKITEDINTEFEKTTLGPSWKRYNDEAHNYLSALYSKTGRPIAPSPRNAGKFTPQGAVRAAEIDTEAFKRMDTLAGGKPGKPSSEMKQFLLTNILNAGKETSPEGPGFVADAMRKYVNSPEIKDKFMYAFNSDERAAIQNFVHTAYIQNSRGSTNQLMQMEAGTGRAELAIAADILANPGGRFLGYPGQKGAITLGLRLKTAMLGKILIDPQAARQASTLMKTPVNSPAARGRLFNFIHRTSQLGINLTIKDGSRIYANPETKKLEIIPKDSQTQIGAEEKSATDYFKDFAID